MNVIASISMTVLSYVPQIIS